MFNFAGAIIFLLQHMIKNIITVLFSTFCLVVSGQTNFTYKISEPRSGELLLTVTGTLDAGWHISNRSLHLEQADGVTAQGGMKETLKESTSGDDGSVVTYEQRFAVSGKEYRLRGYLQYMACTDMSCLAPQTVEFEHHGTAATEDKESKPVDNAEAAVSETVVTDSVTPVVADKAVPDFLATKAWTPVIKQLEELKVRSDSASDSTDEGAAVGLLTLFLLAFGGGLLALLTPCVWPMIPLTVSFFMRQGERDDERMGNVKGAMLYGGSIVVIFLTLGIVLTVLFGANALNLLSTNAIFNVICFLVLSFFGVSLLGLFELRLPSSWANALDEKSGKTTGIVSIFLMALTMVVVSFSCTAPVMGLLLVQIASATSDGGGFATMLTPVVGMLGFAIALALPFTLFALFPQWLKRMPKSGGWMTRVKVTLGFLEIAFALKFLSVADMAYGWHILPRNVFLVVWIVLVVACGIYHGVDWQHHRLNPLLRQKMTAVCFVIAAYLIPGLWGAPCTLVSAFLPPMESAARRVLYDYDAALRESAHTGKPVFIDFTGYGCVNCRKMEAAVFTDQRVQERLQRDYIVVQLYVDDRTPLPQQLQVNGKTLRTVGDKWALLEIHKFGSAAQPFYVIVDAEGTPLTGSYAYDESVERFMKWLSLR